MQLMMPGNFLIWKSVVRNFHFKIISKDKVNVRFSDKTNVKSVHSSGLLSPKIQLFRLRNDIKGHFHPTDNQIHCSSRSLDMRLLADNLERFSGSLIIVKMYIILGIVSTVYGHGRLMDPPGRSSMWRFVDQNPLLTPYKE